MLISGDHLSPAAISIELKPPGVLSIHHQPFGSDESSTTRLQVPASLPFDLILKTASSLLPGSTLTGSVGISNVAL